MLFWDPTFIFLIPAIILAIWAQSLVQQRFHKYSRINSSFGLNGAELARRLLDSAGLFEVKIESIPGKLSDHYDPRSRVVRLSSSTFNSHSIAALGIVAHEIGHAIQHKEKYAPLEIRNVFAPVASFGSGFSWIIFLMGLLFWSPALMKFGILLFLLVVLFTLITLPVELNASKRAHVLLNRMGMPQRELAAVDQVLNAAAMTYVASVAMALMQLLRMLFISGLFGDRN
ncbi:MAG: peptidase [Thermotogae bacterium]|uniref:Zinc metallopeptidase n=1 Tax=Kosmotoga arenicorallina TaxID=688066 RepID=A0A7C5DUU5_9BACT|nr:zinc metallopeptidase [Kosmotoga sp.]MBO8166423.1 zinc metallopeptidase [Kosmotoga sp.]MCD6159317.1 zinc metallopeptidase [Kosmotoga sp.]RKX48816.1 MAG: peptidase [Thermotogota bacterium]HHF08417.1 zinc metallopeptidase [Kosmotoga arenicorallina]